MKILTVEFIFYDQHYLVGLLAKSRLVHGLHECTIVVYVSVFIMENSESE